MNYRAISIIKRLDELAYTPDSVQAPMEPSIVIYLGL